ncbi:hypothetical protein BJ875DRAFT_483683 [Amylocarpus encephaloides]|uniref:Uncharacterized protein n=1 Tax=Amylocarpus encephaloides TaxID=45428 RepID=A0A9P7YJH7_9HELO|nr:hypothetical protein BJ875DRAFT_483683 [Amylocarpus encephaloides]
MTEVIAAQKMSTQKEAILALSFKCGNIEPSPLLSCETDDISNKTRELWVKNTSKLFLTVNDESTRSNIRDWDLILNYNGSVENIAPISPLDENTLLKVYPPRYRLPEAIRTRLETPEERITRMESFALGGIIYEILFHKPTFDTHAEDVEARIAAGHFPDGVWQHKMAERMLGSWCPEFGKQLINKPLSQRLKAYSRNHPWYAGAAAVSAAVGTVALSLPFALTAAGFGASGVAVGSLAAGVQSSIGLVQVGSIFAWCQSVGAGGGALTVLLGYGYVGIGTALGATLAGVLDGSKTEEEARELNTTFLDTWKLDMEPAIMDEKAVQEAKSEI